MELFVYLCTFNVKSNQLMKNLFLLFILSASIISCKKEYTCECTDAAGNPQGLTVSASNSANAVKKCNKTYINCHIN